MNTYKRKEDKKLRVSTKKRKNKKTREIPTASHANN